MAQKPSITIVGPGSMGSALARVLNAAGFPIAEIVYRSPRSGRQAKSLAKAVGAKAVTFRHSGFTADVIWLCVGDAKIALVASEIAKRRLAQQSFVFHSSGALSTDELSPLGRTGAKLASVHPMMTFVRSAAPSMKGVTFALEGDRAAVNAARKLVEALDGESFEISKKDKPLYHALGAFVSPLIVAQMATAERIGRTLGLKPQKTRKLVGPILQQTVRNYLEHGPAAAFSGPLVRGDAATVSKNLAALRRVPGTAEIYRALARIAAQELPSKDRKGIIRVLRGK